MLTTDISAPNADIQPSRMKVGTVLIAAGLCLFSCFKGGSRHAARDRLRACRSIATTCAQPASRCESAILHEYRAKSKITFDSVKLNL